MDKPQQWELENAARKLHATRGPLHRLLWHSETSKGEPCSECIVSVGEVLDQFVAHRRKG